MSKYRNVKVKPAKIEAKLSRSWHGVRHCLEQFSSLHHCRTRFSKGLKLPKTVEKIVVETVIVRWELFLFCNQTVPVIQALLTEPHQQKHMKEVFSFFLFCHFKLGCELLGNPHFHLPAEEALCFHHMVTVWFWVSSPQKRMRQGLGVMNTPDTGRPAGHGSPRRQQLVPFLRGGAVCCRFPEHRSGRLCLHGQVQQVLQKRQGRGAEHRRHLLLSSPCTGNCDQTLESPSPSMSPTPPSALAVSS